MTDTVYADEVMRELGKGTIAQAAITDLVSLNATFLSEKRALDDNYAKAYNDLLNRISNRMIGIVDRASTEIHDLSLPSEYSDDDDEDD